MLEYPDLKQTERRSRPLQPDLALSSSGCILEGRWACGTYPTSSSSQRYRQPSSLQIMSLRLRPMPILFAHITDRAHTKCKMKFIICYYLRNCSRQQSAAQLQHATNDSHSGDSVRHGHQWTVESMRHSLHAAISHPAAQSESRHHRGIGYHGCKAVEKQQKKSHC